LEKYVGRNAIKRTESPATTNTNKKGIFSFKFPAKSPVNMERMINPDTMIHGNLKVFWESALFSGGIIQYPYAE
jgi:hypothetical protein